MHRFIARTTRRSRTRVDDRLAQDGRPTSRAVALGAEHRRWWRFVPSDRVTRVTQSVMCDIAATVGAQAAETGGMLGGSRLDGVVDRYFFDEESRRSRVTYSPDVATINGLLRERWNPAGVNLLGFVHSHPVGSATPSAGDEAYAEQFFAKLPELDRLLLPIAQSYADLGRFELHGWVVERDGARSVHTRPSRIQVQEPWGVAPDPAAHAEFGRVETAYDLELLARTRVVAVGVGGAAAFLDDLVRCGVGEVVVIDPDHVEPVNVGTQQVYRSATGLPKVDALAARLLDASPMVHVVTVVRSLADLDDVTLERLCCSRLDGRDAPEVTLLCGFTDDFDAQARVARLGLHLGIPTLAAQVYGQGRGAEVTFAVPGATPACQRCVLGGRYRAILDKGESPVQPSSGTPIFATTRLNAIKGSVALAIVHGVSDRDAAAGERWRSLFARIRTRNLVQIRLDPDIATTLGLTVFDRTFAGADRDRIVMDDAVWLPQLPENPQTGFDSCPDCGGTGDLRVVKGTLADTRLPPAVQPDPVSEPGDLARSVRPIS